MASAATYEDRSPAIGRIFARAFATIGAYPLPVFGVALLFAAVPQAGLTFVIAALATSDDPGLLFTASTLIGALVSMIFSTFSQGALVRITVAHAEDRRASIGEALWSGLRVALPLLALGVLLALGIGVGLVLFVVPGVMLWIMWSVAAPALVEERRGVFAAFARSRALTRGARWRILALELVVFVFYWLIAAFIGIGSIFFGHMLNEGSRFIVWTTLGGMISKTLTAAI